MEFDNLKVLLNKTEKLVEKRFADTEGSHDWFHIQRVRKSAVQLSEEEGGNLFIIEMAALLHDWDDWKLTGENQSRLNIYSWLTDNGLSSAQCEEIRIIINEVSFKGAGVKTPCSSIESAVVQDADRLDALGAIGIARAFAYGGSRGQPLYQPGKEAVMHASFNDYKNSKSSTIHHFHEKLLLLSDRMNTKTAALLAEERHRFMLQFLNQFFIEWKV